MATLDVFVHIVSSALLVAGSAFVLVAGIGVLRLPDLFARMHAAGITDSAGTIMVLLGLTLEALLGLLHEDTASGLYAFKLTTVFIFLVLTGPTATYALANAAIKSGDRPNGERYDPSAQGRGEAPDNASRTPS